MEIGHGWPCNIENNDIVDFHWLKIAINVGLAACILLASGIACELLIRRREGRKP